MLTYGVNCLPGPCRCYCSEPLLAFLWTEVSKAANKVDGGLSTTCIPLSLGSKLELLSDESSSSLLPRLRGMYTSPYLSALAKEKMMKNYFNTFTNHVIS